MQGDLDSQEDPNCCTKPEPELCKECGEGLSGEWKSQWNDRSVDFCDQECLEKWLETNWEDHKGEKAEKGREGHRSLKE